MTIDKPLESVTEDDLKQLIENQVLEAKRLDYKLLLPTNSDSDKKEFLADVSSFANSNGGDILYGISQDNKTGYPLELVGIDAENVDREMLRLESIAQEGIEPRIPLISLQPVKLKNSKVVLIIRVQKSWISPHRIKFKEDHHFWMRATNGKYRLDIGELRNAFTLSNSLNENIKQFRENRIASIYANEITIPFSKTAKIVLHLIPLSSFDPSVSLDMEKARAQAKFFVPLHLAAGATGTMRYTLEGLLAYAVDQSGTAFSYTQLYRNGIIEIVDSLTLKPSGDKKDIPSVLFEELLISMLPNYLAGLKYLNVEQPIVVFLTVVGAKGYSMATDLFTAIRQRSYEIDREILLLPEAVVSSYETKAEQILKPAFDALWNSCGFPKSPHYNEKGEWKKPDPLLSWGK
jgi:hypothetical protein